MMRLNICYFVGLILSILIMGQANAQLSPVQHIDPSASYGQLVAEQITQWEAFFEENYFAKGYTREDMRGTGYKQFLRQKAIYERRISSGDQISPANLWEAYAQTRKNTLNRSTSIAAEWISLGPNTIDTLGGRMLSHAFDPEDSQIIWSGSGSGGLWRTSNGGETLSLIHI